MVKSSTLGIICAFFSLGGVEQGMTLWEVGYTFVTFIDARKDLSVGVCNICLTLLCLVVGQICGEEFPPQCNLRFFFFEFGGCRTGNNSV